LQIGRIYLFTKFKNWRYARKRRIDMEELLPKIVIESSCFTIASDKWKSNFDISDHWYGRRDEAVKALIELWDLLRESDECFGRNGEHVINH
jgi:hypothetical protein